MTTYRDFVGHTHPRLPISTPKEDSVVVMVGHGTSIRMFVCRFLRSQPNYHRRVDPPALFPASSTCSTQSDLFFLSHEEWARPSRVTIAFSRRRLA